MKIQAILATALLTGSAFAQSRNIGPAGTGIPELQYELLQMRMQLMRMPSTIIVETPEAPRFIPGESDSERAQRRAQAAKDAQERWREEWSARNPHKFSMRAPRMPREYEREALRQSDEEAAQKYAALRAQATQPRSEPNPEVARLRTRITALEKRLGEAAFLPETIPATPRKLEGWEGIKVGMSEAEVTEAIGVPNAALKGRWLYSGGGIVEFTDGKVSAVKPQWSAP